jgi:hypothetical protein
MSYAIVGGQRAQSKSTALIPTPWNSISDGLAMVWPHF